MSRITSLFFISYYIGLLIVMNFIFFFLFIILSICTGYTLLIWSMKWTDESPFALRIGSAYFIGLAFFISVVRFLSTMLNHANWALWITVSLSVVLCIFFIKHLTAFFKELFSRKSVFYMMII